jgi:hypothetical protein
MSMLKGKTVDNDEISEDELEIEDVSNENMTERPINKDLQKGLSMKSS